MNFGQKFANIKSRFLAKIFWTQFVAKILSQNFWSKCLVKTFGHNSWPKFWVKIFDQNFWFKFCHVTIKLGPILDKKCKFLMKMCILVDHNLDSLTKICSAKITHFRCKILRYQLTHPSDSFPIFSSDKNLKIFI